jgi:hypothetical protein
LCAGATTARRLVRDNRESSSSVKRSARVNNAIASSPVSTGKVVHARRLGMAARLPDRPRQGG